MTLLTDQSWYGPAFAEARHRMILNKGLNKNQLDKLPPSVIMMAETDDTVIEASLQQSMYKNDCRDDAVPTLASIFRQRLVNPHNTVKEKAVDCCLVLGLNHNVGVRLYDSVYEYQSRVEAPVKRTGKGNSKGYSYAESYALNLGTPLYKGALVTPYWTYGAVMGLGLR